MSIYNDEWVRNDFISNNPDIIIQVDNVIKLKNTLGEAFWVIINEILPNDKYVGQVNNHLIKPSAYNYDDIVIFTKEDIRDYKNAQIQMKQQTMVNEIVAYITQQIGRTPTLEEIDLFFTKFTAKS